MKNDLSCAVVRDLLPAYAEGLTAPETNEAVERHLAACPACAAHFAAISSPETAEQAENDKEVDYLKAVRRRGRLRVVLAVALTVLALIGVLAAMVFIFGSPADTETMVLNIWTSDEALQVEVSSRVSANAYWGWETETADGVVTITAREGLVSALHPTAAAKLSVPLEGIDEVYLCGRLIWQEGTITAGKALERFEILYEAQTPYVGNPSALNQIAQALSLNNLGSYTFSLQTSAEPYGWTIVFDREIEGMTDTMMSCLAPQMLAVVGNLGTVSWTYPDAQGTPQLHTLTLEEINARLGELTDAYNADNDTDWPALRSVKDYAQSPVTLQRLDAICWQMYADATWPGSSAAAN